MEKLISNITRLVARHNCVIMPGMGAFLAHDVSASYNAEEQIFMPPHRTLGFNPQVTVDDALLLSEYLNDTTLSYEDACNLLEKDIARLRHSLSRKGTFRFGELGTFSMNINGEIAFEPGSNGIDDPKNFGFEPLVMPLLSQCEKKDIVIKRHDFGRYVAAAAAIILAFFFVTPVSDSAYDPGMQASFTGIAPKSKGPSSFMVEAPLTFTKESSCEIAPVADTATEKIITAEEVVSAETAKPFAAEEEVSAAEPADAAPINEAEAVRAEDGATFHIIVGSMPSAKGAQRAIKELSHKMDTEYSVVEGDRRFRIAVESFSNEKDANIALARIKKTFPDAWVLKR